MRIFLVVVDSPFAVDPRVLVKVGIAMTQRKNWSHFQDHTWLIGTGESVEEVREAISRLVTDKEGISFLIVEITPDAQVSGWQPKAVWDWLATHRTQVSAVT